jgi:hypothetical protein
MSNRINSIVTTIGIDIGKNAFHVVGLDQRGAIVLRQRWSRRQVEVRLANMPPCLVGMEACVGAHHLSRRLQSQGHDARLMPAKYVRPYSKGQKNDFRDAEAIAEAVQRPTMKFVPTKTADQLDLQALHRVRERLVSQRTGVINQIRAFLLERGIAVRQGLRFLRAELPIILATRSDVLSGCRGTSRRLASTGPADCRSVPRNRTLSRSGSSLSAAYDRAGYWTDHLKCHGGRDRQRRGIHQGTRLRRLARTGAQQISTGDRTILGAISRQSLSAGSVRAGGLGRADPDQGLGPLRAQNLDRGREKEIASQRAGDRACQSAGPHCLGGSQQGTRVRMRQDARDDVPTCLRVEPCSEPSRPGPAGGRRAASLDSPSARCRVATAGRDEGTALWHEQRNCTEKAQR